MTTPITGNRIASINAEIQRLKTIKRTKRAPGKGFGGALQLLREKCGLSVRALAKKSDLAASVIVRLETESDPNPRLQTILALARGLNMSPIDFFAIASDAPF